MDLLSFDSSINLIGASSISFVNFIAITYFSEFYTACVIKTLQENIPIRVPIPLITITVDSNFNDTLHNAIDGGCQAFIVSEGALIPFLDEFVEVHDISVQRSPNKRLMVLMDSDSLLDELLDHRNIFELPHVLIVINDAVNGSIACYTTKIFNNGTRSTKNVVIEPINDSNYFPDKINNMNGIPIHLNTIMYPPYIYYEETTPAKANARYAKSFKDDIPLFFDGTEAALILELCRKYNCNIEASFDEVFFWGNAYDNHTGIGLYGSIVERHADIALAAMYYWLEVYKFATFTHPLSRSGITVIVPRPRILPPWRTPFLSFTSSLWAAVLAAFCVGVLGVWLLEKVRFKIVQPNGVPTTFSDSLLTMIGFYMEQNAKMRIDLTSCVLMFTSLLFAGFMIGNCYSGGLAGVMTVPEYEKPIDTIYDLADSGLLWGSNVESWVNSILTASQPHYKKLVKTYRIVSKELMAKHTKMHDMGFVGERTEFNHFAPVDFVDSEASTMLQLLKDDLNWESVGALITKTCPFMQKLNELIMHIKQSGIQNYWELQVTNRYLRGTIQLNIMKSRSAGSGDDVVKLSLSHFLGAYIILAIGLGLASLAFCFEISHKFMKISGSRRRQRKSLQYSN